MRVSRLWRKHLVGIHIRLAQVSAAAKPDPWLNPTAVMPGHFLYAASSVWHKAEG